MKKICSWWSIAFLSVIAAGCQTTQSGECATCDATAAEAVETAEAGEALEMPHPAETEAPAVEVEVVSDLPIVRYYVIADA